MSMEYDALAYEMPWRPNYEGQAALGWVVAAGASVGVHLVSDLPPEPFWWMTGICGAMAFSRIPAARRLSLLQKHLAGRPLEFIKLNELQAKIKDHPEEMWLGQGFEWENRHAQRVFDILKRDWASLTQEQIDKKQGLFSRYILKKEKPKPRIGQPWIHGVEPKEKEIYQPLKDVEGHTGIIGTTGAGKTRMFDLLISQGIYRDEASIVIDPKGDKELAENARAACVARGQPEKFLYFNPAFPEKSCRIDPMRNFSRPTELATRLASLISPEAANDPFVWFGWMAINNIVNGLLLVHQRPNLLKLRYYLEGGPCGLVIEATQAYGRRILGDKYDEAVSPFLQRGGRGGDKLAIQMVGFYHTEVRPKQANAELEGLFTMYQHDRQHFAKMIATLLPIMSMLTSGPLGSLLSPDPDDTNDSRPIVDIPTVINNGMTLCIGLDSLPDAFVGSAIGSLFASELTAVAGERYNYGVNNRFLNLYIDEASEVLNHSVIQLLNKGRGALFRLFVATQTIADFAARLGDEAKALQVLGNLNNLIILRTLDTKTQEYVTDGWPKTRVKYVMRTQGQNTDSSEPILHGGNQGERLMEEEADLMPPPLLGMLPNLEYVAKISGGRIVKGRVPILVGP